MEQLEQRPQTLLYCHNPSPSPVRGHVHQTRSGQAMKLMRNSITAPSTWKKHNYLLKIKNLFTLS